MGRPLFSKSYPSPAVRAQPTPIDDPLCRKWSPSNNFDPDSEEFFANAQYEAFIETTPLPLVPAEVVEPAETDANSEGSADSTETSGSTDTASPMATGPDDPAVLIADAYPELSAEEWGQRLRESTSAASEWLETIAVTTPLLSQAENSDVTAGSSREEEAEDGAMARSYRTHRPRSASAAPALIPLSALLSQTRPSEALEEHIETSIPPVSPSSSDSPSRAVNTPAQHTGSRSDNVQRWVGPRAPVTPQPHVHDLNTNLRSAGLLPSSSPTSVTPRFYSWQSHPIPAIPTTTIIRGARDGPLTNPQARRSFARLGPAVPVAPVMLSNTVN